MDNACEGKSLWSKVFGCKFEPRFDSKIPENITSLKGGHPEIIEAIRDRTYVKDICTRCGKEIYR